MAGKIAQLFAMALCSSSSRDNLDLELGDHLEREIEHNIRSGMSPHEAKFAAGALNGLDLAIHRRGTGFVENVLRDGVSPHDPVTYAMHCC